MKVKKCVKESFVVIGKEGSTLDGDGFIQKYGKMRMEHFVRYSIWQKKMNKEI